LDINKMDLDTSLALVFPGQGSQSVGMLQDYAGKEPGINETFNEASGLLGYDLWDVIINGPKEKLDRTDITQPALLTAGVAIWRLWLQKQGAKPAYMAGHSLGEYTALVCAGSLQFTDAVTLVRDRGLYMQDAVPECMRWSWQNWPALNVHCRYP
jgi:[acyl-carrier-protein] S-malonyltransferase